MEKKKGLIIEYFRSGVFTSFSLTLSNEYFVVLSNNVAFYGHVLIYNPNAMFASMYSKK